MEENLDYYVYAYLRVDGSPYYIGKGKDRRAFVSQHHTAVPPERHRIVFLEKNLTELGALALERRYIKWYGRKNNGTGILRNLTDGGEGNAGRVLSEETKEKIRISTIGHQRNLNVKRSEDAKRNMCWWTNPQGQNKRSEKCPGDGWVRGKKQNKWNVKDGKKCSS